MLAEPLIAAPPRQPGLRIRLIDVLGLLLLALLAMAWRCATVDD
ncbi:hypothetical protein QWZ03_11450 [Chitinimonas viridis]|uniref:Uncharacterized protein n=1 Tax=Chitinimonas viridis TaxID=664880 RepID=A0ABT8B713_9NEIS|nr:hypothetical protein [Chitinimonas viridis]MDN3577381.1 hypothetical protein [Chitinimonas viridis]